MWRCQLVLGLAAAGAPSSASLSPGIPTEGARMGHHTHSLMNLASRPLVALGWGLQQDTSENDSRKHLSYVGNAGLTAFLTCLGALTREAQAQAPQSTWETTVYRAKHSQAAEIHSACVVFCTDFQDRISHLSRLLWNLPYSPGLP